jgi:hypothetical protein
VHNLSSSLQLPELGGEHGVKAFERWSRFFAVLNLVMGLSSAPTATTSGSLDLSPTTCSPSAYRQFDFWIGDWDAFNADNPNKLEARLRVDSILEGCVLREDYQDVHGHKGQSFSIYDAPNKRWHQTWVTNRGELLQLNGAFLNGQMVLTGRDVKNGKLREIRGIWKSENGNVRETAVLSLDGRKSWQPWFDLIFRAHTSKNS